MQPRYTLGLTLLFSAVLGTAMVFIASSTNPEWSNLRVTTSALSGIMAIMSFGAAALFLSGLKDFKSGPRKAYRLLCIGIIFFGIAQAQIPLMEYFSFFAFLLRTGFIVVPYLLSVILIFVGMRAFARTLNIHTRWASVRWALAAALALAVLSTFAPHIPLDDDQLQSIRITGALTIWDSIFFALAARLAWLIRRDIGPTYKNAMTWLFSALIAMSIAGLHYYIVQLALYDSWYERGGMVIVPFFLATILMVRAGYAMLAVQQRLNLAQATPSGQSVFLDVVDYAAELVSTPREIDSTLDAVRRITSDIKPGEPLTADQEKGLCNTYKTIENYLVTKDAIRIVDLHALRSKIIRDFKLDEDTQAKLWG